MRQEHLINNETVHNWKARYAHLPYFADLSATARRFMEEAYSRHQNGSDCAIEAIALADQFHAEFTYVR